MPDVLNAPLKMSGINARPILQKWQPETILPTSQPPIRQPESPPHEIRLLRPQTTRQAPPFRPARPRQPARLAVLLAGCPPPQSWANQPCPMLPRKKPRRARPNPATTLLPHGAFGAGIRQILVRPRRRTAPNGALPRQTHPRPSPSRRRKSHPTLPPLHRL